MKHIQIFSNTYAAITNTQANTEMLQDTENTRKTKFPNDSENCKSIKETEIWSFDELVECPRSVKLLSSIGNKQPCNVKMFTTTTCREKKCIILSGKKLCFCFFVLKNVRLLNYIPADTSILRYALSLFLSLSLSFSVFLRQTNHRLIIAVASCEHTAAHFTGQGVL